MTKIQPIQKPPYQITSQPSYNAVKIDIHNPQVNTCCPSNSTNQGTKEDPVYSYPNAPIYEVPKKSVYEPKKPDEVNVVTATPQPVPVVPPPVIVQPISIKEAEIKTEPNTATNPTPSSVIDPNSSVIDSKQPEEKAEPKTITIEPSKPDELNEAKVDINEFITKLTSSDFEAQVNAMEAIAEIVQTEPKKATELLDTKVIDTLLGIMSKDTSTLEGPTPQQLEIRERIITGKPVTDSEKAEANKISAMELAERNKQYAIYTVAIMQKLYSSEIEKINNTVVAMTELPGAAGIVEQIKNNPNPMVRAAGIDALSYMQRPEYVKELVTIFAIAQQDQSPIVQKTAIKALERLAKMVSTQNPNNIAATTNTSSTAATPNSAQTVTVAAEATKKA